MNRRGTSLSCGVNRSHEASPISQGTPMPLRVTRSASSTVARHPQTSLVALMDSPTRRNMPHLQPQKMNGGLWFDIDDCIDKDITAAWQADFWGQWWNYDMIPQSTKDAWWSSFVQKYYWGNEHHDAVFACWKRLCKESIENLFSKRKRSGKKKLDYSWETEMIVKKSKTGSENYILDKDELGMHLHATQHSGSNELDAISETGSTATGPSRHQPNDAYLETDMSDKVDMNKLDTIDMRVTRLEEMTSTLKLDLEAIKLDLVELKQSMKAIFEALKLEIKELNQGLHAILRFYGIDPITLLPMGSRFATPVEKTISTTDPTP